MQSPPLSSRVEGMCSWLLVKGQGWGQDPMSVSLTPEPALNHTEAEGSEPDTDESWGERDG